jgi:glycosyltransferase involved in cell wall biosynthesis
MPQISIIMPVFNTDKYLRRTLDALVNQTFGDIEIIAIDDGSTDDSLNILNEYAERDSRVVVITQKNSGPATARNKGLDAATGKYLMFCDSDDWYEPNMCQVMFDTIEKQKTDLVMCRPYCDVDSTLSRKEYQMRQVIAKYVNSRQRGKYKLTSKNISDINVMLWNKIWRHDLVKQYNIRFPDGHEHDDVAFFYMYFCMADSIFITRERLYHYVWRAKSIMSSQYNNKPKNKYDNFMSIDYLFRFLLQNQAFPKHSLTMTKIFFNCIRYVQGYHLVSTEELVAFCADFNAKISNVLRQQVRLVVWATYDILFIKNKSYIRLVGEWFLYTIPMVL